MAKKIRFESFKYQFLVAAQDGAYRPASENALAWPCFVGGIDFTYQKGAACIAWQLPIPGCIVVRLDEPTFYSRGDRQKTDSSQDERGPVAAEDPVKLRNHSYFREIVMRVADLAGYEESSNAEIARDSRIEKERVFHDSWAGSEVVENIDVLAVNRVCTAPEMRYITLRLGNLNGKRLLDIGCGLGEASVYFAMMGADVTSSDLSQGMLDATSRLARTNGVSVVQHVASAEDMRLPPDAMFDVIYAGNLLHHTDVEATITRVIPHLAVGGTFVSWDPLAYNPAINVYRSIATDVRTPDEHPLKWNDIQLFRKHFGVVETRYFWLTTLVIFVIMALAQRRNPNRERFWKVVVQEGNKWRRLYLPLEKIDELLLRIVPPLRLLCWNVVIVARKVANPVSQPVVLQKDKCKRAG